AQRVDLQSLHQPRSRRLVRLPCLRPYLCRWVVAAQLLQHLFQILIAAEKGQVVAGALGVLARHQLADWRQRGVAVLIAGGQVAHHLYVQLFGTERRGDVQALGLFRQAEQVEVVVAGAEGGGEQRGAVGVLETRAEKGRRQASAEE